MKEKSNFKSGKYFIWIHEDGWLLLVVKTKLGNKSKAREQITNGELEVKEFTYTEVEMLNNCNTV